MKRYCLLLLCCVLSQKGMSQEKRDRPLLLSAGISLNPGLMLLHKEYELGPAVRVTLPVYKNWNAGAGFLTRKVWAVSLDKKYGYKQHISFPRNNETVFFIQTGYSTKGPDWIWSFDALGGVRHEVYHEKLLNTELGIDEEYRLRETNFMFGVAVSARRRIYRDQFIGIVLMLPVNRIPQDDSNRYSIELGWSVALRGK